MAACQTISPCEIVAGTGDPAPLQTAKNGRRSACRTSNSLLTRGTIIPPSAYIEHLDPMGSRLSPAFEPDSLSANRTSHLAKLESSQARNSRIPYRRLSGTARTRSRVGNRSLAAMGSSYDDQPFEIGEVTLRSNRACDLRHGRREAVPKSGVCCSYGFRPVVSHMQRERNLDDRCRSHPRWTCAGCGNIRLSPHDRAMRFDDDRRRV